MLLQNIYLFVYLSITHFVIYATFNNDPPMITHAVGWLPHRGKAQMACNYCFPTRKMF